jgi:hypothetical protein
MPAAGSTTAYPLFAGVGSFTLWINGNCMQIVAVHPQSASREFIDASRLKDDATILAESGGS